MITLPDTARVVEELPRSLRPAFAPLVRRAFGVAVGVLGAIALCALAVEGALRGPDRALAVWLVGDSYLPGYAASWSGAGMGLVWGFALGFCIGWFLAFGRNLMLAVWVATVRAKEQLRAHRDILDQY